jgi:alkanesulfonate monooxygenase SsuD/methylene tetrahydromethanopterin reductase-like flavin-dependent oxidoreductase (luciferase family)
MSFHVRRHGHRPKDERMELRIFTEPRQGASCDTLLRVAQAAEQLDYDAFFRSDHCLRTGDGDGLPGPTEAWITLAGLAARPRGSGSAH